MSNRNASGDTAVPASSAVLKLRLLASAIEACGDDEAARYEALRQRCEMLSEQVLARPVRSWSDVIEIAEIAHFWGARSLDGELVAFDGDHHAPAKLIMAVLKMARGGTHLLAGRQPRKARSLSSASPSG